MTISERFTLPCGPSLQPGQLKFHTRENNICLFRPDTKVVCPFMDNSTCKPSIAWTAFLVIASYICIDTIYSLKLWRHSHILDGQYCQTKFSVSLVCVDVKQTSPADDYPESFQLISRPFHISTKIRAGRHSYLPDLNTPLFIPRSDPSGPNDLPGSLKCVNVVSSHSAVSWWRQCPASGAEAACSLQLFVFHFLLVLLHMFK